MLPDLETIPSSPKTPLYYLSPDGIEIPHRVPWVTGIPCKTVPWSSKFRKYEVNKYSFNCRASQSLKYPTAGECGWCFSNVFDHGLLHPLVIIC